MNKNGLLTGTIHVVYTRKGIWQFRKRLSPAGDHFCIERKNMWYLILFAIFALGYYALHKRLSQIEDNPGKGISQSFSIYAQEAVLKNKRFGELAGIKSIASSKNYKDWGSEDKKRWQEIIEKTHLRLTYLSIEDTYFVQVNNTSYMILPSLGKRYLYTENLTGNDSIFQDSVSFGIVERNIKIGNIYHKVLTAYLEDSFADLSKKSITNILFDFPIHTQDVNYTDLETLGFQVERSGGDDVYEDSFGEMSSTPTSLEIKKNGAGIRFTL